MFLIFTNVFGGGVGGYLRLKGRHYRINKNTAQMVLYRKTNNKTTIKYNFNFTDGSEDHLPCTVFKFTLLHYSYYPFENWKLRCKKREP